MMQASPPNTLLGKALAIIGGVILVVLGFMFSLIVVAVVAVIGLAFGAWFFWKTRHLRKALREAGAMRGPMPGGEVIEGEAIVVEEYQVSEQAVLPDDTRKP
jgi:UPF0716 family protein affecting phage T7 exclusion